VTRPRRSRFPIRVVASVTIALAILAGLAVMAGIGFAATGSSGSAAYEYQYGKKVIVCHHTGSKSHPSVTISISQHAVPAHLKHGDTVGPCQTKAATVSTAPTTVSTAPTKKHGKSKAKGEPTQTGSGSTSTTTSPSGGNQGNGQGHGNGNGNGHGKGR
jgi:hypothetical protein